MPLYPELYRRYHRLFDDLARSCEPGSDWRKELRARIDSFEADVDSLDVDAARMLREELCAQLEHEALHWARPLARDILFAAVKRLEIAG
jgi:hypothetical protein